MRGIRGINDWVHEDSRRRTNLRVGLRTPADRLQLFQGVRDLEKSSRAGKGGRQEVGSDAVGENGDVVVDGDAEQVIDLVGRQKLGLVDEEARDVHAGRRAGTLALLAEQRVRIGFGLDEKIDGPRDPEPGRDLVIGLRVDRRLRKQHSLAALLVVVRGLQKRGRLAGVHRAIAEVQFCHAQSLRKAGRVRRP